MMHVCRQSDVYQERVQNRRAMGDIDERKLPHITMEEVRKHNTADDCWMVIHGGVYDVKSFLHKHPGGSQIMLKYAGMDATLPFDDVGHSMESLVYDLPAGSLKGIVDLTNGTVEKSVGQPSDEKADDMDCITMAHDRSLECRKILNKFYTLIIYVTIIICVSLLLYMRLRWHFKIKAQTPMVHKIRHHLDEAFASSDTHQVPRGEEVGIPAWAY